MNKGAYLILSHSHFPIQRGENKGKVQTTETCEFLDTYKKRHLQTATVIMDVLKREFIKNTFRQDGVTYDQIEEHVIKGYADKYRKFLELVGAAIPEALLLDKDEVEAELAELEETTEESE